MKSEYMAEVSRLANEYRALIVQAKSLRMENNNVPTRKEAECYKRAAEVCSKLANLNVGEARHHWAECEAEASLKLREISNYAMSMAAAKSAGGTSAKPESFPASKGAVLQNAADGADNTAGAKQKSRAVPQNVVDGWFKEPPKHGFEAVAGMEDLIEKLRGCVRDVAASRINQYLGMDMVHSFFLYGPPGCGKTFISQAFAHELMKQGYKYMSLSGGDIHNSLVGESEKYVERAFQEAEANAPCILFIDEIDSVCRNRAMPNVPAHAMSTTTAFLTGYNDICHCDKPVIFIGATNYPNLVDNAMMDRVELIKLPLPDLKVREHAFQMNFEKVLHNESGFSYADMAEETDNYNQRDIKRLTMNLKRIIKDELKNVYKDNDEAAVEAMQNGQFCLTRKMFMEAVAGYRPSKKDDILRSLDAWDDTQQKRTAE